MPHLLRNSLYSACPKSPGKMRAGTVESFSIADGLRETIPPLRSDVRGSVVVIPAAFTHPRLLPSLGCEGLSKKKVVTVHF